MKKNPTCKHSPNDLHGARSPLLLNACPLTVFQACMVRPRYNARLSANTLSKHRRVGTLVHVNNSRCRDARGLGGLVLLTNQCGKVPHRPSRIGRIEIVLVADLVGNVRSIKRAQVTRDRCVWEVEDRPDIGNNSGSCRCSTSRHWNIAKCLT